MTLNDRLRQRINEQGTIPVSEYVQAALYDPNEGFYQTGGGAGRAADFLTAAEVGPLFGAVIARAVDAWWGDCGFQRRFKVYEWGAGKGTLARAVLAAEPQVLRSGALRWYAIEMSATQRAQHLKHSSLISCAALPTGAAQVGVVLANELLDNLPFDLYERRGNEWLELRVTHGTDPREFATVGVALADASVGEELDSYFAESPPEKVRVVRQLAARRWLSQALESLHAGRVVVFDYGGTTEELAARGGWLRTHLGHIANDSDRWLRDPGAYDITADVATDQLELLREIDSNRTQAEFLRAHGIDRLVAEGKQKWQESAHIGDLAALQARSRIREAEALCDPSGMGAFRVLEWLI